MEPTCHRCGASLVDGQPFCPHCGAPQLRVEDVEPTLPAEKSAVFATDQNAGMLRWRAAVQVALWVAAPAAVLSAVLNLGSVWVFAGGFVTVALYRRRTSAATDAKLGWRIGGLMGMVAATLWLAIEGGALVVERYLLHHGSDIDTELRGSLQVAIAAMEQKNPSFATDFPWFSHFWLSPVGIASMFLGGSCALALSMILFSAIGGAIGGRYLRSRAVSRPLL
jgi:hypothetical protein